MTSEDWIPIRRTQAPTVVSTTAGGDLRVRIQLNAVPPQQWAENALHQLTKNGLKVVLGQSGRDCLDLVTTEAAIAPQVGEIDKAIEGANRNFETIHLDVLRAEQARSVQQAQDQEDGLRRARDIAAKLTPPGGNESKAENPTGGAW